MAATAVKILLLSVLSCSLAFAGVINVSSNAQLTAANSDAGAGDTVKLAAGTYTVAINPANPGSSGAPIVYMPATVGAVCSLYVATPSINLATDYVIVQDIRVRASNASNEMTVQSGDHTAILRCNLYAFPSATASWDTWQITGDYNRFIGNYCNGGETSRDADSTRHEGIVVGGVAKYFVIEGNTVHRITHYGLTVQGGGASPGPSWGIIRNNVVYDCHVNIGQNYLNKNNLYEGNRAYSGGQMLSYRPGISYEGSANQSILRYNMFYGDSVDQNATGGRKTQMSEILTQSAGTIDYDNRLYGNAFVGLSRNVQHQSIVLVQNDAEGNDMGKSVWVNNILAYPNTTRGGYCYVYQDGSAGATKDTLRNNLFWAAAAGDTVTDIDGTPRTLAATEAALSALWYDNIEAVPLWVDSLSLRGNRSFAIAANSPCVDAGAALTTVASNVSASTVVPVGDALYFHYDWGASPYDRGDSVLIGANRCELDSVDYTNRRLILKTAISVGAGAEIHVLATYSASTASYVNRLSGVAPDIGPYERTSSGGGVTLSGSTTLVAPDSNSTQMQPITFRWRAVAGATKYWFSLSLDNWSTLVYNNDALTDTFVTVSGLTVGAWGVWNVATGNEAGWNTDAWSSWWTVEVGENAPTADTLTVDWNKTIVPSTLTASTLVEFSNLQRRDLLLVLHNAAGSTVEWPASVRWLGRADVPQPTAGDTTVYWFVRDGAVVYGFDLSAQAAGTGVTASWVISNFLSTNAGILKGLYAPSGLTSGGTVDSRAAIQTAINQASVAGGTVKLPAGTYLLSSYTSGRSFLTLRSNNVQIVGDGIGKTILRVASPGTVLDVRPADTTQNLTGVTISGVSFEYSGGLAAVAGGFSFGMVLNGDAAVVQNCSFANFLNGLYVMPTSRDVLVSGNSFTWEHGRASVSYPIKSDVGQSPGAQAYFLHPTLGLRNWGERTRVIGNFTDCMSDSSFSDVSAADSFKIPVDGFVHGTGKGGIYIGNTILRAAYEGIYVEAGSDTNAQTIVQGNYLDGRIPPMIEGRQTSIGALPYSFEHNPAAPDTLYYGGWGIRADGNNASISGNTIKGFQMGVLTTQFQSSGVQNVSVSSNVITDCLFGIWLDSTHTGTVIGNTIRGLVPTAAQREKGYTFRTGIKPYYSTRLLVASNNISTSHYDWYHRTVTTTATADSTQHAFHISDTTGIRPGRDWGRYNFVAHTAAGSSFNITAMAGDSIVVDTIYTAIDSGATLYIAPHYAPAAGGGISPLYSDSCVYAGNMFTGCVEPISNLGASDVAWPVYRFDCLTNVETNITGSGLSVVGDISSESGNVVLMDSTLNAARVLRITNSHGGSEIGANTLGQSYFAQLFKGGAFRRNLIYMDSSATSPTMPASPILLDQTASRVLTTDGSSKATASSVTTTTLGYLDATSSIQTQFGLKADLAGPTFTGSVTISTPADAAATVAPFRTYKGTNTQTNQTNWISGVWDAYIWGWNNGFGAQQQNNIGRALFQADYDADGRLDNSTFKVRLAADNSGTLADIFSLTRTSATLGVKVIATQFQLSALNTAPANAGDTGTTGEIRIVDGYIYVCTATNTWKRVAISTWP